MRTMSVEACLEGLMQNDRDLMEVVHLHISLSKLQERFIIYFPNSRLEKIYIQGGSNMTGTDLCVNKPHCAAAVRP